MKLVGFEGPSQGKKRRK